MQVKGTDVGGGEKTASKKLCVNDEEYTDLKAKLNAEHTTIKSEIDSIVNTVNHMVEKNGGLYADNVSANIKKFTTQFKTVGDNLQKLYSNEVELITKYVADINKLDVMK